jgi:hypothetical protein
MKSVTTLTTVVLLCLGSNVLAQGKQQLSFSRQLKTPESFSNKISK